MTMLGVEGIPVNASLWGMCFCVWERVGRRGIMDRVPLLYLGNNHPLRRDNSGLLMMGGVECPSPHAVDSLANHLMFEWGLINL